VDRRGRCGAGAGLLLGAILLGPGRSEALVHLWNVSEVYSNAEGSVQFVEFFTPDSGELVWSLAGLDSDASSLDGFTDLAGNTANRHVLLGTEGLGDLPGGVEPDFILPPGFFSVEGDTLVFRSVNLIETWDTWSFGPVPVDGRLSLHRDSPGAPQPPQTYTVAANSPTNYAGEVGSLLLPEPRSDAPRVLALATVLILARSLRRGIVRAQRPPAAPRAASTLQIPEPRTARKRNTKL
jgi:hypothetical protein